MNIRTTCAQAAKALVAMPDESAAWLTPQAREDIKSIRARLKNVLHRAGYELAAPGSSRIKAFKQGPILGYHLRTIDNVPPAHHHSNDVMDSQQFCMDYSEEHGKAFYVLPVRVGDIETPVLWACTKSEGGQWSRRTIYPSK